MKKASATKRRSTDDGDGRRVDARRGRREDGARAWASAVAQRDAARARVREVVARSAARAIERSTAEADGTAPMSIFDDLLLEERGIGTAPWLILNREETSVTTPAFEGRSPTAAARRRLGFDWMRAPASREPSRTLSASRRRTTLSELISTRRTLRMGVSERAARMAQLAPGDPDSARESPETYARKAVSESMSSEDSDTFSVLRPPSVVGEIKPIFKSTLANEHCTIRRRDSFETLLAEGLEAERLFAFDAFDACG
ncbi:unnamed product [Ostreococcus tauri]|uniref:Unnamed product n=1 Tax=Ostreococcus tauri TaxID=70448 RepID=A0A090M6T8_OSTTA|nr:unnamed product [Ostreococcus tauri]CEF99965.1 unnamed product [Ostreococcus tauri]|eukprot:XP_003082425.2 unnamed product [Ostreococcus tauri]